MDRRLTFVTLVTALALSACSAIPAAQGERAQVARQADPVVPITRSSDRQCLAQLGSAGSLFTPQPDRYDGNGCIATNVVSLTALRGDRSTFQTSNLGAVACPTANTFAGWARFGVDRAARQILGASVARIETMGSYNCRNVAGTSRRSAHSRAEAIDVAAFVLSDGRRISLADDWNGGTRAEREFLRVVHRSACKRFGTVLGPEYNSAHRDHFHLEMGDGSFCR